MKTTRNTSFGLSEAARSNRGKEARTPIGIVLFLMIFLSVTAVGEAYGQGVGISEVDITPHPSAILELQSTLRGFLVPRMDSSGRNAISSPAHGLLVFDTTTNSFWYYDGGWKEIRSISLGSANQLLGMNAAANANEYKTLSSSPNITITHTTGDISLNTVQDIQTTSSPTFNDLTLTGLSPNSGVYTDNSSTLTTTPPLSGTIGYWRRDATGTLTPSTSGDNISTTGSLSADDATFSGDIAVSGDITVGGTVDGRDVSQDGTYQDNLQTLTGVSAGTVNLGSFTGTIISDNTTIRTALQELETSLELQTDDQTAAEVAFTPAGNISSTNVQDAIEELDSEKLALAGGTMSGDIDMGTNDITNAGDITADLFIKNGGSSLEFLKADGSVDASTYLTSNQLITFSSTGDVSGSASGNTTLSPTLTIGTNVVTNDKLRQGAALSVIGVAGNSSTNVADIVGSADQILRVNSAGDALAFGPIDLSKPASVGTGVLGISNGGTGATTATDAFNALSPITTTGDMIYGSAANVSSRLPGNTSTTTMVLTQTGDGASANPPEWKYPPLSFAENYLGADVGLLANSYSGALASITLEAGTWMITSETTIIYNSAMPETWNATVVLGTAANLAYTSGQSSSTTDGISASAITISLSKIATLTATTTVSIFAATSVASIVVNTPPINPSSPGTATAIHAIRIK